MPVETGQEAPRFHARGQDGTVVDTFASATLGTPRERAGSVAALAKLS